MTAVEILTATRDRIITKGWSRDMSRCLYSHLCHAADVPFSLVLPSSALEALRLLRMATGAESIVLWNDQQTSYDTILNAIDAALMLAEGR